MAKKRIIPKTFEEVEKYITEKNLAVDPKAFWDFFTVGKWVDSRGNPVYNWKQKAQTWHRHTISKDKFHKCSMCSRRGVYIVGHSYLDGYPIYRCHLHKPKEKPIISKAMAEKMLKIVPSESENEKAARINANLQKQRRELEKQ